MCWCESVYVYVCVYDSYTYVLSDWLPGNFWLLHVKPNNFVAISGILQLISTEHLWLTN